MPESTYSKNKKANKIEKYHVASYKQILRVKRKN